MSESARHAVPTPELEKPQESIAKAALHGEHVVHMAVPPHSTVRSLKFILRFWCLLPASPYLTTLFDTMQIQMYLFKDNEIK